MTKESISNTNNEVSLTNDNAPINVLKDDLSREEIAMYFKYGMDRVDDQINAIQKKNDALEKSVSAMVKTMSQVVQSLDVINQSVTTIYNASDNNAKQQTEVIKAIGRAIVKLNNDSKTSNEYISSRLNAIHENTNNLSLINSFSTSSSSSSTKSAVDKKEWLSMAWKSAEVIGKKRSKHKVTILHTIYSMMRENGIDLDERYDDYKIKYPVNPSIIKMISENIYLRDNFEKYAKLLHDDTSFASGNKQEKYPAPDDIIAGIDKYKTRHSFKTRLSATRSISVKMSKLGKVNMKQLRKDKELELHHSGVSFGYLVGNDVALKKLFNKVVEEY